MIQNYQYGDDHNPPRTPECIGPIQSRLSYCHEPCADNLLFLPNSATPTMPSPRFPSP